MEDIGDILRFPSKNDISDAKDRDFYKIARFLRKNRELMENIAQAVDSSAYNPIFYFYFVILLVD